MGNYEELKAAVASVIKTNGNQEITGNLLQNTLLTIISTMGSNATFAGIATPTTNPGTPDANVFYIAKEPGVYTGFSSIEIPVDDIYILVNDGSWRALSTNILSKEIIRKEIYNVSLLHPNGGIDGTDVYDTFSSAVQKVPSKYRTMGIVVSWKTSNGFVAYRYMQETADYRWSTENFWSKEIERNELCIYNMTPDGVAKEFSDIVNSFPTVFRALGVIISYKDVDFGWSIMIYNGKSTFTSTFIDLSNWKYVFKSNDSGYPVIRNNWIVKHNNNIKKDIYERINAIKNTIIDILIEYPNGRPVELDGYKLCVRNIPSDSKFMRIAYYDTQGQTTDSNSISIDIPEINVGIQKIETKTVLYGKEIIVTLYVDTDRLPNIDNTNGVIISSLQGQECLIEIQEKNISVYNVEQFNNSNEQKLDGWVEKTIRNNLLSAFHSYRYIDVMPQTSNSNAPLVKIGLFNVLSSTEDTLTFSEDDASCLDVQLALVCKTNDDKYYICQFSSAVGNTITKLYDYGENVDMTTVVSCMALHGTIRNGNGQHLSPWGYKAIAELIVKQSNNIYWMANEVIGGFTAISCNVRKDWRDGAITRNDGLVLSTPTYNSLWKFGGNTGIPTPSGGTLSNSTGITQLNDNKAGNYWNTKTLRLVQGQAGAKIQYPFMINRDFKGFVKMSVCNPIDGDYEGTANINVYDEKNVLIESVPVPHFADNIYIDIDRYIKGIIVEVEILENKNTFVNIGNVTIVENYSNRVKPIDKNSIVAILGSSNTQYPPASADYIDIVSGDPFNEVVVRPNETLGDGYGYYPKEIGKIANCEIDNWGKSGETTNYGLETIHEVFEKKRYTHAILSYFGNDINAKATYPDIINNIWEMCEFVKGHGTIPIIICGYGTASAGQTTSYGKLHDYLMQSISNPYYE